MILLLVGLLLVVVALPVSDKKEEKSWSLGETETEGKKTDLEERLENLLESVEGVGQTRVVLMVEEESGSGLYHSGKTEVTGVLIAAEGAGNAVVTQNIQQAVMALFQVEAHKIKIMKMK